MIGLDTNILARYYIQDEADAESLKQRQAARSLMEAGKPLMVCKTVLLEFEWVMRGYYDFQREEVTAVVTHMLSIPHLKIEDRTTVEHAFDHYIAGLDLADALHHASHRQCRSMATFDKRKFANRTKRLGLSPTVSVPR